MHIITLSIHLRPLDSPINVINTHVVWELRQPGFGGVRLVELRLFLAPKQFRTHGQDTFAQPTMSGIIFMSDVPGEIQPV